MKTNRFEFRLDPATQEQLHRLARQTGRSQGDVIRSLIRAADRLLAVQAKLDDDLIAALFQKAGVNGS